MSATRPNWPGIIVRLVIFLSVGALAVTFQADRWSRRSPEIAAFVPTGLGGHADLHKLAATEVAAPGSGVELARNLVAIRPMPAEPLRLLGNSAIERDEVELASGALTLAAQRGWRDTLTQIAVLASAVSSGQWQVAAQRLEAMARTAREASIIENGLGLMLADPQGMEAVADRLQNGAPLTSALAGLVRRDEARVAQVADTLVLANSGETALSCEANASVVRLLLTKSYGAQAIKVWPNRCRVADADNLEFDLDLDTDDPLAWQFPNGSGLGVRSGDAEGTLDIRNRAVIRQTFASRYLMLGPGDHILAVSRKNGRVSGLGPDGQSDLFALLSCDRGPDGSAAVLIDEVVSGAIAFSVPVGCATQRLTLSTSRGTAESVGVEIN